MKSYAQFAFFLLMLVAAIVAPVYILATGDYSLMPLVKFGAFVTLAASSVSFVSFLIVRAMSGKSKANARSAYDTAMHITLIPRWRIQLGAVRMLAQSLLLLALGSIGLSSMVMVALVLFILSAGFAAMHVRAADMGGVKVGRTGAGLRKA